MQRERSVLDGAIQVAGVIDRAEADLLVALGEGVLGSRARVILLKVHT